MGIAILHNAANLFGLFHVNGIIFIVGDDKIAGLQRFKDSVKEVAAGYECGISLEKFTDIKVGDIFEAYTMEEYRD